MISRLVWRMVRAVAVAGVAVLGGATVAFVIILCRDALPAGAAPHAGDALRNLPVVEVASAPSQHADTLVIYYSGDGGWTENDRSLVRSLAGLGAPVVALDTLHYFVWRKSPERAAADLTRIIDRYGAVWRARKVVLVGFSYGANVLPTIVRRLPARVRERVTLLALIAPVGRVQLVLSPPSLMDITGPGARTNADEIAHLAPLPVLCLYGAADANAICQQVPAALVHSIRVGGGHQFTDEHAAVVEAIAQAARRSAPQPVNSAMSRAPADNDRAPTPANTTSATR